MKIVNLSDVSIVYYEMIPESKQMPEFYACGGSRDYAIVTRGDREVRVAVNGEMDLTIPTLNKDGELEDNYYRLQYGYELDGLFKDDAQLWQFIKTISNSGFQIYRQNPWWEVYDEHDPEGGVYDTFYDAIEGAISTVLDDQYWEQY